MTDDLAEALPRLDGAKDWKREGPGLKVYPVEQLSPSAEGLEEKESV